MRTSLGILGLALLSCQEPPDGRTIPHVTPAELPLEAPAPAAELRPLNLAAGAVVETGLAGGETHAYALDLSPGWYAELTVDQRGIDVEALVFGPGGERLLRVDSPNGIHGPEPLFLVANSPGGLRLEVRPGSDHAAPGRYAVTVDELRPATAPDRRRAAAERTFAAGRDLQRKGDGDSLRRALVAYHEASSALEADGGPHRQADVLARLGEVYYSLGDFQNASRSHERALRIFDRLGEKLRSANALNSLGVARLHLGEPERAADFYSRALAIFRELGMRRGEGVSLNNLGHVYETLGKVEDALASYEQALVIQRELGERASEGRTLGNLGLLYHRLGRRQQALEALGQALALLESVGDRRQAAITLTHLGRVQGDSGRPAEQVESLRRALSILREAGARREEAVAFNQLGRAHLGLGATGDARSAFRQALAIFRELGDRRSEAAALASLGWLSQRVDEPARAVASFEEALPLFVAVGDGHAEAATLLGIARARLRQGDTPAAQTAIERSIERIEGLRVEPASDQLRTAFFASKHEYYAIYVDVLMERHRRDPAGGHAAAAFEASERARARSLLDLMAESGADLRRGLAPELREREAELGRRLNAAETHRLLAQDRASPGEQDAADREVRNLLAAYERLQAEIRRESLHAAALTQGIPLGLGEIQSELLDARTLVLAYALGSERSYLWAVTKDSVDSFGLPPRTVIEAAARRAHALLVSSRQTLARGQAELALAELSRMLLQPAAGRLAGRRLLVIPDGALFYVPFGALPSPGTRSDSGPPENGRPLLADHDVVTLPSTSTLAELRRERSGRRRPAGAVAVLADPVFTASDPRLTGAKSVPTGPAETATARDAAAVASVLDRLPFSRAEAEAILALVPPSESFAALDFAAGRQALDAMGAYRIVHFATHGFFDPEHPELSGLALSMVDGDGRPQDGYLRAHEIYRLDLPADLAVLSACETALGTEVRGEGLLGLTRAFMVAGASRVLVSLWKVEDQATAELMRHFYREILVHERGVATALRQAQLALRRQEPWKSPYYWAGFVLHGDW